jgi:hypothetical protein
MRKRRVRPIAPYHKDANRAAAAAFDRETGASVSVEQLGTYREALAQYHLHPEAKFLNGDYLDRGHTQRRHIQVTEITYIGKEANRWEEQFFLGASEDAAIVYGEAPEDRAAVEERVQQGIHRFGQRAVAKAARMSLRDVGRAAREPIKLSMAQLGRLDRVLAVMAGTVNPTT